MIKLPAVLDRYARRKDRAYSLTFITGLELSKDERDEIDIFWQQEGWLLFCPNEEKEVEIPKEKADLGGKTPSQILYSRMYVAWKNKNIQTPFELWRSAQLESIGQQYLDKIEN
jgi:hypothetical protein